MRTSRFRFGQVVLATFYDKRRKTKHRPVLIIDDDDDYEITGDILVIPLTTSEPDPCEYYHIEVNGDDPESRCEAATRTVLGKV